MSAPDLASILHVLCEYFEGMANGDAKKIRGAFYPDARFQGMRDGKTIRRDVEEFVAMTVEAARSAPVAWSHDDWEVELIRQSGPFAVVTMTDTYRHRRYTDFLTLMREDGVWRIANKAFLCHEPDKPHKESPADILI